eukprot:TRINITY_DN7145_c0_g1_i1.p1 TRINITY_DN7145_c0_g1~~TRINITY_DN7145_c0_g1_i1.p1  ORF type:complete len:428 (+),score=148.04 TRINITY_DN7145_c0_g1_i1:264-1547(+)
MERAVYNGRQLALKVSANSVYGFTGATVGKLPCLPISSSTTAFGRQMIHLTKELVEAKFTKANGYDHDAEVIVRGHRLGDGQVRVPRPPERHAARQGGGGLRVRDLHRPIKLEFEKVYFPYLLMNKKRYAGLLYTKPDKHDYLDCKGIESVRRDNCPLVKNMVQNILNKILIERSVDGAIQYAKQIISDLLMNRLDISHLVISKSLSKSGEEYASKQAHVELVERMKKRDPATAPSIGDRVPFVIIKGAKGAKAFEKSEDPIYVLEHNLPIDATYYLEQQLGPPLERLFEALLDNPRKTLLQGEHTRSISVATPSRAVGGIMKFAKVTITCLSCKTPLPPRRRVEDGVRGVRGQGGAAVRPDPLQAEPLRAPLLPGLDPVPALPGLPPPGRPLHQPGLPGVLHAEEGAEGPQGAPGAARPLRLQSKW